MFGNLKFDAEPDAALLRQANGTLVPEDLARLNALLTK